MGKEESKAKKIKIKSGDKQENTSKVKIKKQREEKEQKISNQEIAHFYREPFDSLEKPASLSGGAVFGLIILTLVVGFIAGCIGSIFIFSSETISLPWAGEVDITKYFPEKKVTQVVEKNITVTEEIRGADLIEKLGESIGFVFPKKNLGEHPAFLEQIYAPWQRKSLVLAISEDGWFVCSDDFQGQELDQIKENWEILFNSTVYSIDQIKKDEQTGLYFLKLNLENIPFVKLADFKEIKTGQRILVVDKFLRWLYTSISHAHWRAISKTEDLVRSSDKFSESILCQGVSVQNFPNSLVFNLKGELVALGSLPANRFIPSWQVQKAINCLSQDKQITYPVLGIDYILIQEAPGLLSARFKGFTCGAIVYGNPPASSPAYTKGLRNADLIIKVDGEEFTEKDNLTYLILRKQKGEKISFTVLRNGEEVEIKDIPL